MKLLKKYLLPALTCLIAVGAAVVPPHISQLRDAKQFGQIHTEELAADGLPVREEPSLTARLALYVRWCDNKEIIPSFQSPEESDGERAIELAAVALERLAQAGVIPEEFLSGGSAESLYVTSWTYILLWDPELGIAGQTPAGFWCVTAELGDTRTVALEIDLESGLPVRLNLYAPNLAKWLAWKDPAARASLGEGFLSMLGLEWEAARPNAVDPGGTVLPVAGEEFYCTVSGTKNQLILEFRPGWELMDGTNAFDR